MTEHWFWLLVTAGCVGWYAVVALYVGVKGIREIRQMLARLSAPSDP
jgi:hypothetical protein